MIRLFNIKTEHYQLSNGLFIEICIYEEDFSVYVYRGIMDNKVCVYSGILAQFNRNWIFENIQGLIDNYI